MNAERLKKAMNDAGYNQKKLAEITGISQPAIGRYIRSERVPNSYQLLSIAKALHVSMDYLMEDDKDE